MISTQPYTPREGSVADRAITHLKAMRGKMRMAELARQLDVEQSALGTSIGLAINNGLMERETRADGAYVWVVGYDGPVADDVVAATVSDGAEAHATSDQGCEPEPELQESAPDSAPPVVHIPLLEESRHLDFALWETKRLTIEVGDVRCELEPEEVRRLFRYLESMRLVLEEKEAGATP